MTTHDRDEADRIRARFREHYPIPDMATGLISLPDGEFVIGVRLAQPDPDLPASFEGMPLEIRVIGEVWANVIANPGDGE